MQKPQMQKPYIHTSAIDLSDASVHPYNIYPVIALLLGKVEWLVTTKSGKTW
jgi:hypothetical protein